MAYFITSLLSSNLYISCTDNSSADHLSSFPSDVLTGSLPTSMRIHLVVNISQIVCYKEQVEGQKKEEAKSIEVKEVKEWKVEKILNKRKIRGVKKYLVYWKRFMVEHDTWEKKKDLENAREVVEEFEGRMSTEVRRQEKLDRTKERDLERRELPEKYMAKMLYGWDDKKFEEEYLRKLERNW